jgi:hypothetical protein
MLPDDVLLAVFDFCVESWQTLVHVSKRWRGVVFGSPRRLDLRLFCTSKTPARDTLDVWPALPLVVECHYGIPKESADNIVAVLEHSSRVCRIDIRHLSSLHFARILATMKQPFPELTRLTLSSNEETMSVLPVLPDSFLGGSAPRLRSLTLRSIPFPGLPKLLLSATHLVDDRS